MDEESKKCINELIERGDKQIIMSGRAKLPEWLKTSCVNHRFLLANKKDFELDVIQMKKLLESYQVKLPPEQIRQIRQDTTGHGYGDNSESNDLYSNICNRW